MAPPSQAPLLMAAILVMLGLSHSTLIQSPLQSVSLPSSTVQGYRSQAEGQREDGTPLWRPHTRRPDGRLRSRYAPSASITRKTPPTISSSYGTKAFRGSLSGIYGYPSIGSRPLHSSKNRLLQRLQSGRRTGQHHRQGLQNNLLDTVKKYRDLRAEFDYPLLQEALRERVSLYDQANYLKMYDVSYENVMPEVLRDELNYLLDGATLKEYNDARGNRDQVSKHFNVIYPGFLDYIISRSTFKDQNPGLVSSKLRDYINSKLAETNNFVSSRETEDINVKPLPGLEDGFAGEIQSGNDLIIYPGHVQINTTSDADDNVKSGSTRDQIATDALSNIEQSSKPVDSGDSKDGESDSKADEENERKLNALRHSIPEETIETSSIKLPETTHVVEPSKEPVQKEDTPVLKLEDLVKGPHRNEDQPSSNGRGRRSVSEKEEDALHAEECHAHNLRSCGQPAMKKLLKSTDMKTKCRVREEFLNCMGDKRFQPCPPPSDPKATKVHPFDDPMLRDLRKSLRKGLATTCIFGYSMADSTALDI